jgi:hypothetical protein
MKIKLVGDAVTTPRLNVGDAHSRIAGRTMTAPAWDATNKFKPRRCL